MGIRGEAIRGLGWVGGLRVVSRIATLVKIPLLARLLTPADFGLFGIVALSLAFFETMTETGINQVLIQSDRNARELVDSAWVVAIVRGFLIGGLIAVSAYPLSVFFHSSAVIRLSLLMALVPVIKGFINPMIVEFQKELQFSREFWFRTSIVMVDIASAVTAAIITRSADAFVIALLVAAVAEVGLSFIWCRVWPKLRFVRAHFKEILSFGKWMTLAGIGHWVASELDDVLAGRLFGAAALGVYQAAYKISSLPVTEISWTVNQVAFPVLSKLKSDRVRFSRAFLTSFTATSVTSGLLSGVLLLFPAAVVRLLLGPGWSEAVPLIQLLALFGFLRSIEAAIQPLFLAIGRPQVTSAGNALKVIALAVGLSLWAREGLQGVALATLVSVFIVIPYYGVHIATVIARKR